MQHSTSDKSVVGQSEGVVSQNRSEGQKGSELTIDIVAAFTEWALAKARWREIDLATQPKGHHVKVKIAQQLRSQIPMSRQWIADRLRMGSASYVSNLLGSVDSEL
jgi:hypothetical protein